MRRSRMQFILCRARLSNCLTNSRRMAAPFPGHNRLVPLFPNIPTFPHFKYLWNTSTENGCYVRAIANVTKVRVSMKNRLLLIVDKRTVLRARDLYRSGIHPEAL